MKVQLLSDNELVDLISQGNAFAFEALYRRYWNKLSTLALNKTQDEDLAKEIVQELFVELWERRTTLSISNVGAYLNTAVRFKIISAYKNQLQSQIEFLEIADESTGNKLAHDDFERSLLAAVALLPEKTKTIFNQSRFEQKTIKEIAADLQLPERTVEYHITQALRFLRLHLQDYFLSFAFFTLKIIWYYLKNIF